MSMEALQTGLAGVKADMKKGEKTVREMFQKQEIEQLKENLVVAAAHYKKEKQDNVEVWTQLHLKWSST